jgi:hypothetical protein
MEKIALAQKENLHDLYVLYCKTNNATYQPSTNLVVSAWSGKVTAPGSHYLKIAEWENK